MLRSQRRCYFDDNMDLIIQSSQLSVGIECQFGDKNSTSIAASTPKNVLLTLQELYGFLVLSLCLERRCCDCCRQPWRWLLLFLISCSARTFRGILTLDSVVVVSLEPLGWGFRTVWVDSRLWRSWPPTLFCEWYNAVRMTLLCDYLRVSCLRGCGVGWFRWWRGGNFTHHVVGKGIWDYIEKDLSAL